MAQLIAQQTLAMLAERLHRIDYALNGFQEHELYESHDQETANGAVTSRLRALERTLHSVKSNSPAAAEILRLQTQHPDLLNTASDSSTLPSASVAELVLAHSPLYHSTSTRLQQLQDLQVPDSTAFAKLVELQPRVQRAQARQQQQARDVAELRARSAKAVQQWYEVGVLEMGEQWADWEGRLRDCEVAVRRREVRKTREERGV